ncbi:Pentatricopeptide repeat (PPR) superfamily protein [Euphorbia peplus]|nr:Pentatricopeptide repeat (PPR) superfamily protein [Euphorbia peplus]
MLFRLSYLTVASRHNSIHQFKSEIHHSLHSLLEICSSMTQLKQIHAQIILNSLTDQILTLGKLISFCAVSRSGNLRYAHHLFDTIPHPNKFMFNSLIRGYSSSNFPINSIILFRHMIDSGHSPNQFTFPFVLKACASESAYWMSLLVHCQAEKLGFGSHVYVQNGLVNAYAGCGFIGFARELFDSMSEWSLVSWNSMIGGYSKMGLKKESFLLFREMRGMGMEPDEFTLVSLLLVCADRCDIDLGRFVHLYIEVTGMEMDLILRNALLDMYAKCGRSQFAERVFERMPEKDVVSWTAMVSAYAKNGLVEFAQRMFEQIPRKNVISWNTMMSCYVQHGQSREALDMFHEMPNLGVVPDEVTLLSVLSACSQTGDLVTGKKIHNFICNNNYVPSITLCNSLIDMYAKCGALQNAMDVFNEMPNKNLVSWNSLLGALALHGCGLEAIKLFENMQADGIRPDEITFTVLLSACTHSGLLDTGRLYFDKMSTDYGIARQIQHYACMVDLLGRGGLLDEAMGIIQEMPMKPDIVILGAFLGACRTRGNVELGKQVMKQLMDLEPKSSGLYVLLSNLYSENGRSEDAQNMWKLMDENAIIKTRGVSLVEAEGC